MDLKSVRKMYEENIENHGVSSLAVGWTSEESHILRFDQFKRHLILAGESSDSRLTIGDYGCGYGALYRYFENNFDITGYHGVDISERMIQNAKSFLSEEKSAKLEVTDKVPEDVDYTFVSGTFNNVNAESKEEWKNYMFEKLKDMYSSSRKGVVFNVLTSYVDWEEKHLFYASPEEFFSFGKSITKNVNVLHDYGLYEWTMAYLR